jgi:hypothetical protein
MSNETFEFIEYTIPTLSADISLISATHLLDYQKPPLPPNDESYGLLYKRPGDPSLYWSTKDAGAVNLISNGFNYPLSAPSGAPNDPQFTFYGNAQTGLYSAAVNEIDITCNGQQTVAINPTSSTFHNRLLLPDGDPTVPSYSFTEDPSSGMSLPTTGMLVLSADSTTLTLDSAALTSTAAGIQIPQVSDSSISSADSYHTLFVNSNSYNRLARKDNAGHIYYIESKIPIGVATNSHLPVLAGPNASQSVLNNTTLCLKASIVGFCATNSNQSGASAGISISSMATFKNTSGTVTMIGLPITNMSSDDSSMGFTWSISGTNVKFNLVGPIGGSFMQWQGYLEIVNQTQTF